MQYNIGDKVVFIKIPNKKYAWELNNYECYTVFDISKTRLGVPLNEQKLYYGVLDCKGSVTTWYEYNDFIPLKKYRKEKLKKLKNGSM